MLISDWSSDVCSSDLRGVGRGIVEQAVLDHEACAVMPFLAGLEHEHDRAGQRLLARAQGAGGADQHRAVRIVPASVHRAGHRSEEHTSELQSLMRISYAVFCLKKKKTTAQ